MRNRLRTLLIVIAALAIFFGGYRLGYQRGLDGRFDYLIELIGKTLKPNSWDDVGGPGSLPWDDPGQLDPDDPFATPK
jgi:hypothetical protein